MASTYTSSFRKTVDANLAANTTVVTPAGETSNPVYVSDLCVVAGSPSGGGTVLVQATWSNVEDVVGGTAVWFNWDAGASTSAASQTLVKATAIRVTAATGAATVNVAL